MKGCLCIYLFIIYLAYFQGPKALQEGVVNKECLHSKRGKILIISKENMVTKDLMSGSLEAAGVGDGGDGSGNVVPFFASLRDERFAVGMSPARWHTNFAVMGCSYDL